MPNQSSKFDATIHLKLSSFNRQVVLYFTTRCTIVQSAVLRSHVVWIGLNSVL